MIRWIRPLLGTAPFDAVPSGPYTVVDVRHLVDKSGNSPEALRDAVLLGANAYRAGEQVVVACDFGVSRSNAIAAGILSVVDGQPYERSLREVLEATAEVNLKLEMAQSVQRALEGEAETSTATRAIFVTGADGFLGKAVVSQLRVRHTVVAPTRAELDLESGSIPFADYCRNQNVGQIVHLAYPRRYTDAASVASSQLMLRAVLDACRLHQIRLILISDSEIFSGYADSALFADESLAPFPVGTYGETKYVEEVLTDLAYRRGEIERITCRLVPVYGPGSERPRIIRTFFNAILRGETIRLHRYRNGDPAFDLLYVSDAADAIAKAVEHNESGVFNIGSGELHNVAELAAEIAAVAARPLKQLQLPIDQSVGNVAFPSLKARAAFGWTPRVSLRRGLSEALKGAAV